MRKVPQAPDDAARKPGPDESDESAEFMDQLTAMNTVEQLMTANED